ncbi:class I adenylate-forming enzyme family protein [Sanguibacter suaedae]|uniref:Acyl--CoA ligase n=1 Tax=Sanguibacter suaedae TaxID=2795737 RepID=A0A934IBU8_9MICO|nr:class I adenylate-forming enzyme family protein [Sanguibacter suaedae]MBI9115073.1 acyl--CoA ligase [Sanguibacter suaedae]
MVLARAVLDRARRSPRAPALRWTEDDGRTATLTAGGLAGRVSAAAADLASGRDGRDPVAAGDLVALDLLHCARRRPGAVQADVLVAVLAVELLGGIALVCDDRPAEQQAQVLGALGRTVRVARPLARTLPSSAAAQPAPPRSVTRRTGAPALAVLTSGSTGRARAVVRSAESWVGSFPAVTDLTDIGPGSVVLVPGPASSSLFCFAALHGLATGAAVHLAPSGAGAAPTTIRGCDAVQTTPGGLETVLDVLEALPEGAPRSLRTAVVGGAALPDALRDRSRALGIRVVTYYGAAETSFVAVDTDGTGLRPFPDVEIDLRPTALAGARELWVRSPWTALGYLGDAGGPVRRSDGWVTVGDLAVGSGTTGDPLVVLGRGTGAVQTGASTVLPEDVEAGLRGTPGLDDVVVLGTPHLRLGEVVTAVVVGDVSLEDLETTARERLAPAQRPRRWYVAGSLPTTGTGKVARDDVRAVLLEDGADPAGGRWRRLRRDPGDGRLGSVG